MGRFQHEPLDFPEEQIRLLTRIPSTTTDIQEYKLRTYTLRSEELPYYEALSYTEGPAHPSSEIVINSQRHSIRPYLRAALEHHSNIFDNRAVWIESICVDQHSISEKTVQAKIAGEISSYARLTFVWLEPEAQVHRSILRAVIFLEQGGDLNISMRRFQEETASSDISAQSQARSDSLNMAEHQAAIWECLKALCEHAYWSRLWAVQGFIKARHIVLFWGDTRIKWNDLSIALRMIRDNLNNTEKMSKSSFWKAMAKTVPYKMWLLRNSTSPPPRLLHLMHTFRHLSCNKVHDKAFALLAISADFDQLQIDYEQSLPDLYHQLMRLLPNDRPRADYSAFLRHELGLSVRDVSDGYENAGVLTREKCRRLLLYAGVAQASKRRSDGVTSLDVEAVSDVPSTDMEAGSDLPAVNLEAGSDFASTSVEGKPDLPSINVEAGSDVRATADDGDREDGG